MNPILLLLIVALAAPSAVAAEVGCSPAAYDSYLEGRTLVGQRTARDLRAALEHFGRAIATDADCTPAFAGRARAHALLFDYPAAREAALDPEDPTAHHWLAICLEVSGRGDEAVGIIGELERLVDRGYPFRSQIASIFTALGDRQEALDWLDRAGEAREEPLLWLEVDPRFDPLRSDARFTEILRQLYPNS